MEGSPLKQLQTAVLASLTEQQRETTFTERALFLATETGEVQKEVLKFLGCYGDAEAEHAKARIAKELCDVIWNACQLATQLHLELDEPMDALLQYNLGRKYW